MAAENKHAVGNPIEQFVLLAKTAKAAAAAELVKQALDTAGVFVFRELMEMPNIKELSENPTYAGVTRLLDLFAYGTYNDYLQHQNELPPLTPNQIKKLKHLTIVSLSERGKCIPYDTLQAELGISNVRELEDLIIEAIYAEIIQGKLDQHSKTLEVDTTIGRDIRPEHLDTIAKTLSSWCDACENVLSNLQVQMNRANNDKIQRIQKKEQQDAEIATLKKAVKSQVHMDQEEISIVSDSREAKGIEKTPKKTTRGGMRSSSKFFNK